MSTEHAHAPYYKVLAWLAFLTIAEIVWAIVGLPRALLIGGLAVMAAVKAALVGLYYMHLRYEGALLWGVICFPIVLVVVMVLGLVWDAVGYY
jgi:cytochrome c oxidase subunit 4